MPAAYGYSVKNIFGVLLLRILAMTGVVVAAVPLVQSDPRPFPWGWLSGLIGALIVYVGTYTEEYRAWRLSTDAGHPHDVALFRAFLDLLPPHRFQEFLERFDFGNSIPAAEVELLGRFVERWSLASETFRDGELERARTRAVASAKALVGELAVRTRHLNAHLLTVKLAGHEERTESVREDARILNVAARAFAADYLEMVRLGRRRLTLA